MYLAVDIGGTKTLVASFTNDGKLKEKQRFETPKKYPDFLSKLSQTILLLKQQDFQATAVAAPGKVNRDTGVVEAYGNRSWQNSPLKKDIHTITKTPVLIENDANLAGLYEAILVKHKYKRVLYLTISTGIGTGIITNGVIDPEFQDSEGGHLLLQKNNKLIKWESLISGKAITERFGKMAKDINDKKTWEIITHDIARGVLDLIAIMQPDAIIIGGGVGVHFKKYEELLKAELKKYETPLTPTPVILQAQSPEDAVIYGCYQLIKQNIK